MIAIEIQNSTNLSFYSIFVLIQTVIQYYQVHYVMDKKFSYLMSPSVKQFYTYILSEI